MEALFDAMSHFTTHLTWRIAIAFASSVVLAVLLSAMLVWFSGWHGILLVILSLGGGMLWNADAIAKQAKYDKRQ
ncbi:hypothetical protein GN316_15140 [Xylophilus sp. Kf1]|nr:hypothetical protein [Xylophilus sp. Kf1]